MTIINIVRILSKSHVLKGDNVPILHQISLSYKIYNIILCTNKNNYQTSIL